MKAFTTSFIFVLLALTLRCFAGNRPDWIQQPFQDVGNSYIEVVMGEGADYSEARDAACRTAIKNRGFTTGQIVSVSVNSDGSIGTQGGSSIKYNGRIIAEYEERIGSSVRVYLLVQTLKNESLKYEPVSVTNKYPFSARVFVPGMAQIYKGQTGKGVGFIVGEVAFIGGIVATECLRRNYELKISQTHNTNYRNQYATNANICAITRNVCIGGAVAVYVWNIIDGAVAKGKNHVMVGHADLRISPYATDQGGGLALNLRF